MKIEVSDARVSLPRERVSKEEGRGFFSALKTHQSQHYRKKCVSVSAEFPQDFFHLVGVPQHLLPSQRESLASVLAGFPSTKFRGVRPSPPPVRQLCTSKQHAASSVAPRTMTFTHQSSYHKRAHDHAARHSAPGAYARVGGGHGGLAPSPLQWLHGSPQITIL